MQNLTLAILQTSLEWEAPEANRRHFDQRLSAMETAVDLVVLPEMFTTGFTMNPQAIAEPMEGESMGWMHAKARDLSCVVTGSLVIQEGGHYYNRLVWMRPDGSYAYYDKKHLFSYAGEDAYYTPGGEKLIVELKGWKIMPLICYDLRFPVWCRNRHDAEKGFDYDCLLYVANWPASRSHAWRILLMARAIENLSYVVGVNRIGSDERGIDYSGDSVVIDPLGENISGLLPHADQVDVVSLARCPLDSHRDRFRAWAEWDGFTIPPYPAQPGGSR